MNFFKYIFGANGRDTAPDRMSSHANGMDETTGYPISQMEMEKNWPALQSVSSQLLSQFGGKFTETPNGHIQTDIAAAASLAGLMILQEIVPDLRGIISQLKTGNAVISEVYESQDQVIRFMAGVGSGNGIASSGWLTSPPTGNAPLLAYEDMSLRLAPSFYEACELENLGKGYYKFAAALAAVRLIGAGRDLGILDTEIGVAIASYSLVAGSKTIPHPDALWQP
jgi:hypothetical protein